MGMLFAITMICFFALFGAALAISRHVRIVRRVASPRLIDASVPVLLTHVPGKTGSDEEFDALPRAAEAEALHQTVNDLAPNKTPDWRFMLPERSRFRAASDTPISSATRKAPAASHFGRRERMDWAYFNKDLGDLSDPYEPQRKQVNAAFDPKHVPHRTYPRKGS